MPQKSEIVNSKFSQDVGIVESATNILHGKPLQWIDYIPIIISSLSLIISAGVLICSVIMLLRSMRNRLEDHRRSVIDDFWFRQIYTPMCLTPLFSFVSEQLTKLNEQSFTDGEADGPKAFLKSFQNEKRSLIHKLMLFGKLNELMFELMTSKLDEFDDLVTEYCAFSSLGEPMKKRTIQEIESQVYSSFGEFVPEITRLHLNLAKIKNNRIS